MELTNFFLIAILLFGNLAIWFSFLKKLFRKEFGIDIIAGVALLATLIAGQYVAGVVILFMYVGGQFLEEYAMRRARRELSLLVSRTPTVAHVKEGEHFKDVQIHEINIGEIVLVKPGEVVSVDGVIVDGETSIDEAVLTGESKPVEKRKNMHVFAGTENISKPILIQVNKLHGETKYSEIVNLVKNAETNKATIVKLADRYSVYFTFLTFLLAGATYIFTGDYIRVISVFVVATPCPLLIATPVAIMSGMSKAFQKGILVKSGVALETLSRVKNFVFDKTGTITFGTPKVVDVIALDGIDDLEIIRLAVSLDQLSTHVLAKALTLFGHEKKIETTIPENFTEEFGQGVTGEIANRKYFLGKKKFLEENKIYFSDEILDVYENAKKEEKMIVFLGDSSKVLGAILFEDIVRPDSKKIFKKFANTLQAQTEILTGDTYEKAQKIASSLGMKSRDVIAEVTPKQKLEYIKKLQIENVVAMVGDGINDAPALTQANVGIALAGQEKTISGEVADIVVLSGTLQSVYDAAVISKKTVQLAKQGIFLGMGASIVLMILAGLGHIVPLNGAIYQELIDVTVILNALRLGQLLKE